MTNNELLVKRGEIILDLVGALQRCQLEIDKNIDDDLPYENIHCRRMNAHLKATNPARVALEKYARMGDG